jgi:hypothetical protein
MSSYEGIRRINLGSWSDAVQQVTEGSDVVQQVTEGSDNLIKVKLPVE